MITIIIFALIGIVIMWDEWNDIPGHIGTSFLGVVIGSCGGTLIAIALPATTTTKETVYNIATLQDNNTTSGDFFLGSGNIDGKMVYVFYYEENGFYQMEQLPYNCVKIIHTSGNPKLIATTTYPIDSWWNLFAIDFESTTYLFEVPKGTIKNIQNLDAQ